MAWLIEVEGTAECGVSGEWTVRHPFHSRVTPLGWPTFLYIYARPASMETVGACESAAVLGAGKDPGGYTPLHKPFRYAPLHSRRVNVPLWSEKG